MPLESDHFARFVFAFMKVKAIGKGKIVTAPFAFYLLPFAFIQSGPAPRAAIA
jgi:hypothetical protein